MPTLNLEEMLLSTSFRFHTSFNVMGVNPLVMDDSPTPASSGFGKSAFGQPAFGHPAFGQSAFGQQAAPRHSVFGQSAFGQSTSVQPNKLNSCSVSYTFADRWTATLKWKQHPPHTIFTIRIMNEVPLETMSSLENTIVGLELHRFSGDVMYKGRLDPLEGGSSAQQWSYDKDWSQLWDFTDESDGLRVIIDITNDPHRRTTVSDPRARQNIAQFIAGRPVDDIKFMLFSRHKRSDSGVIVGAQKPLPLYSTSLQIKNQCDYLDDLLGDLGFSESTLEPFGSHNSELYTEDYGYDSDSDLSYSSEDESQEDGKAVLDTGSNQTPDATVDEKQHHDTEKETAEQKCTGNDSIDKAVVPREQRKAHLPSDKNRMGKVIAIKDTAYVTWRAMLFYLCTSHIEFAPLTSRGQTRARSQIQRDQGLPPKASAKSMYRLADKLGLDELADLALNHIKSQLTINNILPELFSQFTSRYKAISKIELDYAFKHWIQVKASPALRLHISAISNGDFPYASDILAALLTQ